MASRYTRLKSSIKTVPKSWSWKSLSLDTWFLEIIAMLFSIACFVAICCILIIYNQEPRPELSHGVSLNAIVAVLATSCKSSLVFVLGETMGQLKWTWFYKEPRKLLDIQILDSASRGPLGSIANFFQKTKRSFVSVGAAIIVLLLTFDPFIQQIISYPTRLVPDKKGANFGIAKKLEYFIPSIDYAFVFPSGFWSDSDNTILNPRCSSGNCTWLPFQSSGMCSQCSDITNSMDLQCVLPENFSASIEDLGDWSVNATCHLTPPQGNSTRFTIPFYFSSSPPVVKTYDTARISWHIFSDFDTENLYVDQTQNGKFVWPGDPLMVVAYAEIGYNEDYLYSEFASGIRVDKVTQCSLELCLLEYDIVVENGIADIHTSVLDYGELFWEESHYPGIPLQQTLCWKPTSAPSNVTIGPPIDVNPFVQLSPVEFVFCGIADQIKLHENVFVGFAYRSHYRYSDPSKNVDSVRPSGDSNTLRMESVGLDVVLSNVANYMNKQALYHNGSDVHGTAEVIEVFVEIRWLWLILPTMIMISGTMFIVTVMITNNRPGTGLWKSSVLAYLYHGPYSVDEDDSVTASSMEKKAENIVVQLKESESHGNFILREKRDSL
ncbi:hypothetical protein PENSTE_c013G03884 [Penicillium steckii]|uniref:Uncharacterized protein n=1 Tax=Penicillium steckii TaxID=303698 RepID=A0A1V6T266_9EURO|nr:hypothetical protein PENSTE_c013G03884 [Penicillium steckii]